MKRALFVLGALLVLGGGVWGWRAWALRPGRPAVIVNGRTLTAGELALRAETLFADARANEHLVVPPGREDEMRARYARDAARMWIVKEVLLAEANRRGLKASREDEQRQIKLSEDKLRRFRKMTLEEFFKKGPLPEDVKRRDFAEMTLVGKLTDKEVRDRIVVKPQEMEARLVEIQKLNLIATKAGEKPRYPEDRKVVIDILRAERFNQGFRRLFRTLYAQATVRAPMFPEMEKLEGVSPTRPEDEEPQPATKPKPAEKGAK